MTTHSAPRGSAPLKGTYGNDQLTGDAGQNRIYGGAGADSLDGGDGDDRLYGGAGADILIGGSGDDYLCGGAGADTLYGGLALFTRSADDMSLIRPVALSKGLFAQGDWDTASYADQTGGIVANLTGEQKSVGDQLVGAGQVLEKTGDLDTLIGINRVVGSAFDDVFFLGHDGDRLPIPINISQPPLGALWPSAYPSGHSAVGGRGNDTVHGNLYEAITADYSADPSGVVINWGDSTVRVKGVTVAAMSARDGWGGTDYFDTVRGTLLGSRHGDYLVGRHDVATSFNGGAGNDTLIGGAGQDTAQYNHGQGKLGIVANLSDAGISIKGLSLPAHTIRDNFGHRDKVADIENVWGSARGDYLLGSAQDNLLDGGDGRDSLLGGAGDDTLRGGNGDDRLVGGAGKDVLSGGQGSDVFIFNGALDSGEDLIGDFAGARDDDKILLDDDIFTALGSVSRPTALAPEAFWTGTAAHDADDRIIYNNASGALYYDADGNGSNHEAVQFATLGHSYSFEMPPFSPVYCAADLRILTISPALSAGDFLIIA